MSESLSVIVPVFNRPDYTMACLESLSSTDAGMPLKVILPANGSRGSTMSLLREWSATSGSCGSLRSMVVEMDRNKGFAGGVNAGLEFAGDGRVVIMHNDVIVTNGWAAEMSKVMDSEEDAAVVTCRTNYANEQSVCVPEIRKRFEAVKPTNKSRLDQSEIAEVLSKTYPNGLEAEAKRVASEASLKSQFSTEIASYCMLVREGMFAKYGGFDEDFFPRGFEDKFWFQPIERDGFVTMIARSFVHHFGNITSDGPGFDFVSIMKINEDRFKEKCISRDKSGRPGTELEDRLDAVRVDEKNRKASFSLLTSRALPVSSGPRTK